MISIRAATITLILLIPLRHVSAQQCDEKVLEMGKSLGALGYQPRSPQDRCEGLYYDNVSGISVDLVSFTKGKIRYQLRADEVINIQRVPETREMKMLVRGTSFRASPKYRFDMTWDAGKDVVQLPLKSVINESRISSADMGFYGYIEKAGITVYVPVVPTTKFYKTPESGTLRMTVLSNIEARMVVYKIAERVSGVCGAFSPEVKLGEGYEKMEPIELELPQTNSTRELCVEISVLPAGKNGTWRSKQFTVLIPGS